ncbi:hypothetical protein GCM10010261_18300 [Streptomyces pilosus]|nr:hypothetical protein GCM10010261_18300 [Streptomyces pilosus]
MTATGTPVPSWTASTTRPLAPAPSSSDSVYPGTVHALIDNPPGPFLRARERHGTPGRPALAMTDTLPATAVADPPFLAVRRAREPVVGGRRGDGRPAGRGHVFVL